MAKKMNNAATARNRVRKCRGRVMVEEVDAAGTSHMCPPAKSRRERSNDEDQDESNGGDISRRSLLPNELANTFGDGEGGASITSEVAVLHQAAMGALSQADSQVGGEIEAEVLLTRAINLLSADEDSEDEADSAGLSTELNLLYGRIVEWKDPVRALSAYSAAHSATPWHPDANLQLARALWKNASEEAQMATVEQRLRDAIAYSDSATKKRDRGEESDDETSVDATELLARLLLQQGGRDAEAHLLLHKLGYTHTFASNLLTVDAVTASANGSNSNSKRAAKNEAPGVVNSFDNVLPRPMLQLMRSASTPSTSSFPSGLDSCFCCCRHLCTQEHLRRMRSSGQRTLTTRHAPVSSLFSTGFLRPSPQLPTMPRTASTRCSSMCGE